MNDTERAELTALCDRFPMAVAGLLAAVRAGRIDGHSGVANETDCGCVYATTGWLATRSSTAYMSLCPSWQFTDLETVVYDVRPGDVPATSPVLSAVEAALVAWLAGREGVA